MSIMLADVTGMVAEIPDNLRWLSNFSLAKWALEGCIAAECEAHTATQGPRPLSTGRQR